jgi:hypothetical protein
MKKFITWREEQKIDHFQCYVTDKQGFLKICHEYFGACLRGNMKTFHEHKDKNLIESSETSRYSIEVNYRTTGDEALEGFAKICLGYISASMKNMGYRTKHVFTEKPFRLLISSRNWDDGEWTGCITWHHEHKCFVVSKGFYNKDRNTISIQHSTKCSGNSASELTKELVNTMHHLKNQPDRHQEKLKPVPLKRGPKS